MYRIVTTGGTDLGMVEQVNYIKVGASGSYVPAIREKATGIALNSKPYNLLGHDEIKDADTVVIIETDAGTAFKLQAGVQAILFVTAAEQGTLDNITAAEHADLFAEWQPHISYTAGNLRRYKGILYKCVQAHASQEDWTPDTADSLWRLVADPAEEWPEWRQPIGAHDTYQSGDHVSHNGSHWISTADSNVWEPGVFGWEPANA